MYRFETLDDVQSAIQKLTDRQPSLVRVLPRQPGTKESRYMHLFSGDVAAGLVPALSAAAPKSAGDGSELRMAKLENEVSSLREEVAGLRRELAEFKRQF
jgi:hypothetical protein